MYNYFFNLFLFFILFFSSLYPTISLGYPNFIGHGYNSCITCHFNPLGNGPINDYGRAVSATGIASRSFYNDKKPEDLIANESGFLFRSFKQNVFRPYIGYRGLLLKNNYGLSNQSTDWINMQADFNAVLKFGKNDKFIMSGTVGYAPVPRVYENTSKKDSTKEYRSREHYIGFRPSMNWGVYFGLLDKAYGVRVVEHTAYTRATPLLTMNDQSHGVLFHTSRPKFDWAIHYFIGNLSQEKDLRQKGFSSMFEYTLGENSRPGFSFLSSSNNYIKLNSASVHLRTGIGHGNSILFEVGKSSKKLKIGTAAETEEMFSFFQNYLMLTRGFFLLNSIEYYKNISRNDYKIRFGPSLQYFPISKMEYRLDLYNTRIFDKSRSVPDSWSLLGQVHLWF